MAPHEGTPRVRSPGRSFETNPRRRARNRVRHVRGEFEIGNVFWIVKTDCPREPGARWVPIEIVGEGRYEPRVWPTAYPERRRRQDPFADASVLPNTRPQAHGYDRRGSPLP